MNLIITGWVAWRFGKQYLAAIPVVIAVGVMALLCRGNFDALSTVLQYPKQQVLFRGNSPYGKLVVAQSADQLNFYQNGVPIASTHSVENAEETAHYAMAQRPEAGNVLLVSGTISGVASEILKYGIRELVCVELDPLVIEAGRRFQPEVWTDPRMKAENTDGRLFIKQAAAGAFDLVILDLPDPSSSQLNRFFTVEFFREVKRILAQGGVLSFAMPGCQNYVSPELARLLASAHQTVSLAFRNVLLLPGGRTYFLASDGSLEPDIVLRLEGKRIATRLVNRHYLDAMFAADRMDQVRQAVHPSAASSSGISINEDFNPVLYYYHLRYWGSQFKGRWGYIAVLVLVCLVIYLLRLRTIPLAVFASGFASTALEIVLLLGFQSLYGSLYRQVGLMVSLFMAGLALGALVMNRDKPRWSRGVLMSISWSLTGFSIALPLLLRAVSRAGSSNASLIQVQVILFFLTFLLAFLVGAAFPVASQADFKCAAVTAANIYTADLLGACLGALLVSSLLIPLLGMAAVCWIVAGLNLIAGIAVWLGKPKPLLA